VPTSANDAAVVPDAAPVDGSVDAAVADAAVADAAVADAAVADAAIADAAVDAQLNPYAIQLEDVTSVAGTYAGGSVAANPWGAGSGAAVGDIDGDGDLDVVLARCDQGSGGPTILLIQAGNPPSFGTLIPNAGFASQFAGSCAHAVALGDMDGDGDLDIFIALDGPDRLLRNEGGGTFTDVTAAAGVAGPNGDISTGAVWADVNRDGLLDLYVLAHTIAVPPTSDPLNANRLYLNMADGSFRDVGASSGAAGDGSSQVALISDLDNDGELEIYVANDRFAVDGQSANPYLQADAWLDPIAFDSQGVPSYFDCSADYGTDGPRSSMGIALADLNGDGRDDIFVSDWGTNHIQIWNNTLDKYLDQQQWWNLGWRTNPWDINFVSWGAHFVDLDRDGGAELFVANGHVQPLVNCTAITQLNLFLRRIDGTDRFANISGDVGLPAAFNCPEPADIPISSRGVVMADFDGDGDDDILVTPFNEAYRFYRNNTVTTHHFVRVRPRGRVSAPDPVGLVLEVELAGGTVLRRRFYGGGDTYSQSDRVVEVGMGDATAVARVDLHWPSGYNQRIDNLAGFAIDTELTVVEPSWLQLSARVATATDPTVSFRYDVVDQTGAPLGAAGAGKTVTVSRSDGLSTTVVDHGDGSYTAALPHPGSPRVTVLSVSVDGVTLGPRLTINYK